MPRLDKQDADILYSIVAKLIWVSNRGKPYTDLEIHFPCIKINNSTMEDKSKLKSVLQFLKQKLNKNYYGSQKPHSIFHIGLWQVWSTPHIGGGMFFCYGLVHFKFRKKMEYKKFYWSWISRCKQLPTEQHLDVSIYGIPGIHNLKK